MPPDPQDCAMQIVRRARIVRRAETEPPSTMMLSHFSGGNPEQYRFFILCVDQNPKTKKFSSVIYW